MGTEYTIAIPQLPALKERFAQSPVKTKMAIGIALNKAAIGVQVLARQKAPVRTGRLRSSIVYKIEGDKAIIGPSVKYAIFPEVGTGIWGANKQVITPKNKKVLATKINPGWGKPNAKGYYIIGKKSQGQKPQYYMKRTSESALPIVKVAFKEAEQAIIDSLKV